MLKGFVEVGARPPYGYSVTTTPHQSLLFVNDEEAIIVCLVYQWYTEGDENGKRLSINGIAQKLTKMSILTRGDQFGHVRKKQRQGVWTGGMIRHILSAETYIGTWYFGKTVVVKDPKVPRRKASNKSSMGTKQVPRPREEWISVSVPAIIDRDSFAIAQQRLAANPRFTAGRHPTHEYLMSKRLTCSCCGYGIRGKTTAVYQYYVCNGQYKKLTDCHLVSFDAKLTDELIWQWLKDRLQHPELIAMGIREEQIARDKIIKPLRDRVNLIDDMLTNVASKLSSLLDLYLEQHVPKDIYIERRQQLDAQKNGLELERADTVAKLQNSALSDEQILELEAFCAEISEGLDSATFEDKQRYLELLDVYGTLTVEDGEKVVLLRCRLGNQRLALFPTSPSLNNQKDNSITLTARLVIEALNKPKNSPRTFSIYQAN